MIKLQPPVANPSAELALETIAQLAELVAMREDPAFATLANSLGPHFQAYVAARGNPELLPKGQFPRTKTKRAPGDVLYDAYDPSAECMHSILELVEEQALGYCPYCGMKLLRKPQGRSFDRDHVLPRSKYPEFSTLSLNLVLSCDACNDGKGAKCLDHAGRWLFVHPYFDHFLSSNVLTARMIGYGTVIFSLKVGHLPKAEAERVARHVRELDLLDRLAEYALEHVTILRGTLSFLAPDGVPEALRQTAAGVLAIRPNDPMALACEALAASL